MSRNTRCCTFETRVHVTLAQRTPTRRTGAANDRAAALRQGSTGVAVPRRGSCASPAIAAAGQGGQLLTGIEGVSSRPVRKIVLREG